jgi:hypothetical protein
MRIFVRPLAASGLLALAAACVASGPAFAQARIAAAPVPAAGASTSTSGTVTHLVGPGIPPVDASQSVNGTDNRQLFQVLGFSGQVAAPVNAPYSDNAYQTYGGQPGRGTTAILALSSNGSP